ncbi:MAG: Dabb family protein [Lachnospiraceae bacterium]|jgi:heme-degrading monooxygenase HmoA|nr:Dabb family protein [Lachnospiraceae bacterium]
MIRHIVLWNYSTDIPAEDYEKVYETARNLLEPIQQLVPGAISIQVLRTQITSGNREVALISDFTTKEALETYIKHPAHVEAGKYILTHLTDRACFDYER